MECIRAVDAQPPISMISAEGTLPASCYENPPEHRIIPRPLQEEKKRALVSSKVASPTGRKRAPRTCTECHRRKVRCDVAYRNGPCYKCQLYERKCITSVTGRKKALQERVKVAIEKAGLESDTTITQSSSEPSPVTLKSDDTAQTSPLSYGLTDEALYHKARSDTTETSQTHFSYDVDSGLFVSCKADQPPSNASNDYVPSQSSTPASISTSVFPDIFESFPAYIDGTDLEYLKSQKALVIPNHTLQKHLLDVYTRFVHRNVPILDLHQFLLTVDHKELTPQPQEVKGTGRIPLLLFQAVMFAASAYADVEVLRASGYKTRRAAQKRFYRRARILYDLNTCPDRLSTAQSALLLALGSAIDAFDAPGGRDSWYWLGVTTSLAYTLALNRNEPEQSISQQARGLRRRLWWTVVVLDRLLCLMPTLQSPMRAPRISDQDCQVDMLTAHDFELQPPFMDEQEEFNEVQMAEDAFNFIDTAMICWHGRNLSSYQYPSTLRAVEDVRTSAVLKDAVVEQNQFNRAASYTFPISEERASIVVLSASI